MKFYEVVRHNRRLKSEQTPFYRGGKIGAREHENGTLFL